MSLLCGLAALIGCHSGLVLLIGCHSGLAALSGCHAGLVPLIGCNSGLPPLIGCRAARGRAGPPRSSLSAMAASPEPGPAPGPGLEPVLREAVAALGRAGEGLAAALGAVLTSVAAAGGPAALRERERALLGVLLRGLARAPGAALPEGLRQRCFLEGPPGLVLCLLLEALGSAGSVPLPGAGGGPRGWAGGVFQLRGRRCGNGQPSSRPQCHTVLCAPRNHTDLSLVAVEGRECLEPRKL